MAAVSVFVDMSVPLQEIPPVKINLDDRIQNKTISDSARQRSNMIAQATTTATLVTDVIRLESAAICQPTTCTPNSPNKTDVRTSVNSIHAAPPKSTKPQPLEPGLDLIGAQPFDTTRSDAGDPWTTHRSHAPPMYIHTQLKRLSPEQISPISRHALYPSGHSYSDWSIHLHIGYILPKAMRLY
jgi:hypothetical protein